MHWNVKYNVRFTSEILNAKITALFVTIAVYLAVTGNLMVGNWIMLQLAIVTQMSLSKYNNVEESHKHEHIPELDAI